MSYIQYKLVSGEEVIGRLDEDDKGEIFMTPDESNVIISQAMELVRTEQDGYRYYNFKPWMCYQITHKQLLNYNQVIGEALPDQILLDEYQKAVEIELSYMAEQSKDYEEKLEDKYRALMEAAGMDPDELQPEEESNVVNMFDVKKDTVH